MPSKLCTPIYSPYGLNAIHPTHHTQSYDYDTLILAVVTAVFIADLTFHVYSAILAIYAIHPPDWVRGVFPIPTLLQDPAPTLGKSTWK